MNMKRGTDYSVLGADTDIGKVGNSNIDIQSSYWCLWCFQGRAWQYCQYHSNICDIVFRFWMALSCHVAFVFSKFFNSCVTVK